MTDKKGSDCSPGTAWKINDSDRKKQSKGKSGKSPGHAFQINGKPDSGDGERDRSNDSSRH
jgi:hypothetical protein